MSDLMIFDNVKFGVIRATERDGDPWFVAADVCRALDISNTSVALERLDEDERYKFNLGRQGEGWCVSEPGLYSLILGSRKKEAKAFKRWITHDVIPSVRRNGGYIHGQEQMKPEELMARALIVAQRTIENQKAQLSAAMVDLEIARPKAEYFDELVDRNLLTNFRETAKQLKVPPKQFVGFLLERKYVYRDKKGKLLPYEDKNNGLFEVKECFNEKTQWSGTQTLVTPKGRETFRLLLIDTE